MEKLTLRGVLESNFVEQRKQEILKQVNDLINKQTGVDYSGLNKEYLKTIYEPFGGDNTELLDKGLITNHREDKLKSLIKEISDKVGKNVLLLGLAGAPASGKSTLQSILKYFYPELYKEIATAVMQALQAKNELTFPEICAIVYGKNTVDSEKYQDVIYRIRELISIEVFSSFGIKICDRPSIEETLYRMLNELDYEKNGVKEYVSKYKDDDIFYLLSSWHKIKDNLINAIKEGDVEEISKQTKLLSNGVRTDNIEGVMVMDTKLQKFINEMDYKSGNNLFYVPTFIDDTKLEKLNNDNQNGKISKEIYQKELSDIFAKAGINRARYITKIIHLKYVETDENKLSRYYNAFSKGIVK